MNMNLKILKNDFKRNFAGNVSLFMFMVLAASLVVSATIVVTQLIISMTGMYEIAKPPHFLQMHKGEINQSEIDEFNSSYSGITAWQTVPMIDVYGEDLTIKGKNEFTLSDCRLDISLVKQNKDYDLLLDENRKLINVNKGEIGIPVILLDDYHINIGDIVQLSNNGEVKDFKVTAFVHDAQMNSTMCSSTRLLISNEDFNELFGKVGEKEYLIEAYFTDSSMASNYKTAYEKANLPQDGQAVTYTVIFLLSAFRDIAMAMVLILVSMLLVIVALMCIKYTVMATLEEEISEIGAMKAIGMSYKDIRNLYLTKYKIMVAVGVTLGYALALIISSIFTGHLRNTFGKESISMITIGIPVLACAIVYFITNHYCKKVLKKLKKVTVVDALVTGNAFSRKESVRDGLYKSKTMPVDILVSIRETLHNFHRFIIIFVVIFITSGIIIVPMNLLNTMESKEFITYMGSSMDDILIEIDTGENLVSRYEVINNLLKDDADIKEYKTTRRVRAMTINSEDKWINLHIDCGDYSGQELKYLQGNAPSMKDEIALSKLNADDIGKSVGDSIILRFNNMEKTFIISGIYQDVTSGGYTAKASYNFEGVDAEKYQFTIELNDGIDASEKASKWSEQVGGGYDIESMEEFINQILGGVIKQVKVVVAAVVAIGVMLTALIVVLFMKLRLVKDVAQIAAMKAIGFTDSDIRKQYIYKIGLVAIIAILLGTLISNILGESIASGALSSMGLGISKITFIINPWMAYLVVPLLLLVLVVGVTWVSTREIKKYNIISLINE